MKSETISRTKLMKMKPRGMTFREYKQKLAQGLDVSEKIVKKVSVKALAKSRRNADSWMPDNVEWRKDGVFCINGKNPLEVVQGGLRDCYFLASLVSAGWVDSRILNSVDKNGYHTITLYTINKKARQVTVGEDLPWYVGGNMLVYGSGLTSDDKLVTWPAIWEKAYAKFHTDCSNDHPNIKKIGGGIGGTGLRVITGKKPDYFYCTTSKADKIWEKLVGLTNSSGRAKRPMVVSTTLKDRKETCGIVSDHVYSILGIETVAGVRRVVLRNPWGYAYSSNGGNPRDSRDGSWLGVTLNKNGIFSIPLNRFVEYFWTVYYV